MERNEHSRVPDSVYRDWYEEHSDRPNASRRRTKNKFWKSDEPDKLRTLEANGVDISAFSFAEHKREEQFVLAMGFLGFDSAVIKFQQKNGQHGSGPSDTV